MLSSSPYPVTSPNTSYEVLPPFLERIRPRQRADAGIVEHQLVRMRLLGLAQRPVQLEDVGNVLADFVAGAVAADDDVALFVFRFGLSVMDAASPKVAGGRLATGGGDG